MKTVRVRYDNVCTVDSNCSVNVQIDEKLFAPVYVQLGLTNFYHSHQKLVNSIPKSQLRNAEIR